MFKTLSAIANAQIEARAKRRTAALISALPESVQKDIGWKWSPSRAPSAKGSIDWDLM